MLHPERNLKLIVGEEGLVAHYGDVGQSQQPAKGVLLDHLVLQFLEELKVLRQAGRLVGPGKEFANLGPGAEDAHLRRSSFG